MANALRDETLILNEGSDPFQVLVLAPAEPICSVLFSAGRGGNPQKYFPLLKVLAEGGCQVIAPHLAMTASPFPAKEEMEGRLRRLQLALGSLARDDPPVAGLGHSLGATMLLVLAGARASTLTREQVTSETAIDFQHLLLLAPATDFFRGPRALDLVRTPITVWAGTNDVVTPPAQAVFLRDELEPRSPVQMRLMEGAGHFTFMSDLPPQITDAYPDRPGFLAKLADEVCSIATGKQSERTLAR